MRDAVVGLALLVAAAHPLHGLEPPGSAVTLESSRDGYPVVVVRAGAETLRFAIDTGTSRTLVSPEAAARLGLVAREAFRVAWVGGAPRTGLCADAPELRVGATRLTVDGLGWVPSLRRMTAAADVDGLLGADALATVGLWVDARRGRAWLAPAGELARWVDGARVPVERIGRRLVVRVELPALGRDAAARLVLDSGASRIVLLGGLAGRAEAALAARSWQGRIVSAGARRLVRVVPLGEVRVGEALFDGGPAALLPSLAGSPEDDLEDGLLPLRLLGPVLLDVSAGILVVDARLLREPMAELAASASGDRAPGR
jgi:hypothetical protein